ncbi:MAG: hypothetical protein U5L02_01495 [Rheinheimera sp.]|nr:hypothetical protein [Rheinheimera sp.]
MAFFSKFAAALSKWYTQQLEPLWFRRRRPQRLKSFAPQAELPQLPIAQLQLTGDLGSDSPLIPRYQRYYQQFLQVGALQSGLLQQGGIAMLLPLHQYAQIADFNRQLKKNAGNFWREADKARRSGFTFQPLMMANHTPDLLEIRRSRKVRAFGPVLDAFTLQLADLGGAPVALQPLQLPVLAEHWDLYVGVFRPLAGYQQGAVSTNQQLVAYARLHRIGNMLRYAELMGHAQFQRQGVMSLLHLQVVELLLTRNMPWLQGIEYLSYGALEQGSDGLLFWKRKAQFLPHLLASGA